MHSAGYYTVQTLDIVQHVDILGLLFSPNVLCVIACFSEAKGKLISCKPNPVGAKKNVTNDKHLERMGSDNKHTHTYSGIANTAEFYKQLRLSGDAVN